MGGWTHQLKNAQALCRDVTVAGVSPRSRRSLQIPSWDSPLRNRSAEWEGRMLVL